MSQSLLLCNFFQTFHLGFNICDFSTGRWWAQPGKAPPLLFLLSTFESECHNVTCCPLFLINATYDIWQICILLQILQKFVSNSKFNIQALSVKGAETADANIPFEEKGCFLPFLFILDLLRFFLFKQIILQCPGLGLVLPFPQLALHELRFEDNPG